MIIPYSDEWFEARRGKITASDRLHTAVYGTPQEKNAILDAMEEELLRPIERSQDNKYQAWGRAHEKKARQMVAMLHDWDTYDPGLVFHPKVKILAATPDYAVAKGGVSIGPAEWRISGEIKCPYYLKRHYQLMLCGLHGPGLDAYMQKYLTQVQGQILILGAGEGWFASYHPEAPPGQQLFEECVLPDLTLHARMLESCAELSDMLKRGARYGTGVTKNEDGVPQLF